MQPRQEFSCLSTGHVSRLLIKAGMRFNATKRVEACREVSTFFLFFL
jgi:hypothetical protein